MVEQGFQEIALEKTVMVDFLRSLLNSNIRRESFMSTRLAPVLRGSWSRGYDATLTWWRSQVQFLPSPPITTNKY